MKRLLFLMAVCVGVSLAYLKAYEVTPTLASWSGKVDGDPLYGGVGQTFVACFDSLAEVSLFTGSLGAGQNYELRVRDAETDEPIAHQYGKPPAGDHRWLKFDAIIPDGKFIRGRSYIAKFTRPNDSINWYKDIFNKYPYGHMVGGFAEGQPPPGSGDDLCMRLYGKARVGGEMAVQSVLAWKWGSKEPYDPENWQNCVDREDEVGVRSDKLGYGYWPIVQPTTNTTWRWGWLDTLVGIFAQSGVQPTMSAGGGTDWSSCMTGDPRGMSRNLYLGVRDTLNYAARFLYELARRYGPRGQYWVGRPAPHTPIVLYESPSEPTVAALVGSKGDWKGWWQPERVDSAFEDGTNDTTYQRIYNEWVARYPNEPKPYKNRRRFSFLEIFSRYIIVQDSAIKLAASDLGVPPESMPRTAGYCVTMGDGEGYTTEEWLNGYKDYDADHFFDVASLHRYQMDACWYEQDLLAFRGSLDATGVAQRPLWFTEAGWPARAQPASDSLQADSLRASRLVGAYAFIEAANAQHPADWTATGGA
jgi:hypothetical protein